jgi:hypothetical protein
MGLGFVLLGIVAGLLAAGSVLVLGGGIGLAGLAYVGGGFVGMLGGLVSAALPRTEAVALVSPDHR